MALITLISTSELTLVFLMTRTLDLNLFDIGGIRVEALIHLPNIKIWQFKNIEAAPLKSTTSSLLKFRYVNNFILLHLIGSGCYYGRYFREVYDGGLYVTIASQRDPVAQRLDLMELKTSGCSNPVDSLFYNAHNSQYVQYCLTTFNLGIHSPLKSQMSCSSFNTYYIGSKDKTVGRKEISYYIRHSKSLPRM